MSGTAPHAEYALCSDNQKAVVLVHGIGGSPVQFRSMAELLHENGCDCKALLLPGHGADLKSFCRTPFGAWQSYVSQAIDETLKQYARVFLVGHSLGGLLCLEYAATHKVEGLVLINTPLLFKISPKQISINLRVLFGKPERDDEIISEYRRGAGLSGGCKWYEYPLLPRPFLHLTKHMRNAEKILQHVMTRTLIVQSCKDETVRLNSANKLKKGLPNALSEPLWLNNSYHSYFSEQDKKILFNAIGHFLNI